MESQPRVVSFWTFAGPGIAGSAAMILADAFLGQRVPGILGGALRGAAFWTAAIITWRTLHHRNGAIIV